MRRRPPGTISRYTPGARANHWLNAIILILLALSGLSLFHPSLYFLTNLFGGGEWTRILHPWRLVDSTRQTSKEVEEQVRAEREAIATVLATNGLPRKKATLAKVRKQLAGISALVDLWWQPVPQDLAQLARTPKWTQWADELLLPLMYWQEQLRRTRHPVQKAQIALMLQAVEEAFEQHLCTRQFKPEVLADCQAWVAAHAKAFQRASSAVEGRNGYLSQMHHNHRGLPRRRYRVWTVLHNFDCRAKDGSG